MCLFCTCTINRIFSVVRFHVPLSWCPCFPLSGARCPQLCCHDGVGVNVDGDRKITLTPVPYVHCYLTFKRLIRHSENFFWEFGTHARKVWNRSDPRSDFKFVMCTKTLSNSVPQKYLFHWMILVCVLITCVPQILLVFRSFSLVVSSVPSVHEIRTDLLYITILIGEVSFHDLKTPIMSNVSKSSLSRYYQKLKFNSDVCTFIRWRCKKTLFCFSCIFFCHKYYAYKKENVNILFCIFSQ